jgi:hypothetical protein
MIFYAWISLRDSDPAAARDGDPAGRSHNDLALHSDSDPAALTDSDLAAGGPAAAVPGAGHSGLPGSSVAMGISDDRGRAMKAGEETLGSGRALLVIIEAVRPAMAPRTLAPCYVRTGVGWLGRCTVDGEVTWDRFFVRGDPGDQQAPGTIEP